ncbi:hypothetical protein FPANT_745 [Fusarium pseudoanthophilum]|uniref:Uncharacterized protein n=1 Tax=Fusarium pseudoanthophilum TaxID=48495 RepID=A0A8H5Q5C8_9HYPO|nr:hypothetical protein FPANT_745 [Fusarium pseudoanthophilum]
MPSSKDEQSQLTVGELKELIEMNIKALCLSDKSDKVRLFLVKRVAEHSGQILYGAGVASYQGTKCTDILLRSSGERLTIESALEDILDQTMAELSEKALFPEWCIKELNGMYCIMTKT